MGSRRKTTMLGKPRIVPEKMLDQRTGDVPPSSKKELGDRLRIERGTDPMARIDEPLTPVDKFKRRYPHWRG
jgi:hypothetical protein